MLKCNRAFDNRFSIQFGPYAFVIKETQPSQHSICCETPLDYGAAEYELVEIQTDDGIILSGWYVPPNKTPGAVIELLHGSHGDRRGTAWHARLLIEEGYGVLLYDQRAMGESTVDMNYTGWLESRPDVDAERIAAGGFLAVLILR